MELNIGIVAVVLVIVILLLFFILRKNHRDQLDLEETIKKTELSPDKHEENRL